MHTVRYSEERGKADHGWLDSRHTFSFGHYYDPQHMGFGPLRVINEDRVKPGAGFGTHGHSDMEIISYVLEGELEHKDSLGTGSVIRPGDVQVMSAGTGIRHSEFNRSRSNPLHFLQIWVMPDKEGVEPRYDQKNFADAEKRGRLRLVASPDGADGSVMIHQDARIYASIIDDGVTLAHDLMPGRVGWVQVVRETVSVNGEELRAGDGIAIKDATITAKSLTDNAEILVFDLPA
jgi:quercetin 2,3-dioxygenase